MDLYQRPAEREQDRDIESITRLLARLHRPTTCVGTTMSVLVPFPCAVRSLPDATLLDLAIDVDAGDWNGAATVLANARYSTAYQLCDVEHFYLNEFDLNDVSTPVIERSPHSTTIEGSLDSAHCIYRVAIESYDHHRSVKVSVRYHDFDPSRVFDRFAEWHSGYSPTGAAEPTGVALATYANTRGRPTVLLCTTRFRWPDLTTTSLRPTIDRALADRGWSYSEPRAGSLFLEGEFDGEVHVWDDAGDAYLDFVGEFELPCSELLELD